MTSKTDLKICVVDEPNIIRHGIVKLLGDIPRISEVVEASTVTEALELNSIKEFDLIILDLNYNTREIDELRFFIRKHRSTKILILTLNCEPSMIYSLLEIGVHGYLHKKCQLMEIEDAIQSIVDNNFYHTELVSSVLRNKLFDRNVINLTSALSLRELEVLKLLCLEHTCGEIAERLSMKEKTVHVHRRNIMIKIGGKNSISLYKFAIRNNIANPP